MKQALFYFIALLFVAQLAVAEDEPELFTRYKHNHISYQLNADGSHVETHSWAMTVLKEGAVARAKQTSITYSTSIQKAEVLEAYTRKSDGRRIDVPKSNFQVESNRGKDKDAPVFSDLTTLTAVFPEVGVGDTLVFSYQLTQVEPMFQTHFSAMLAFPRAIAYDDVRISIDWPATLWVQYEVRELAEKQKHEKDGRNFVEWAFQNKQPLRSKRRDYSVYDVEKDPGLSFSTFRSYSEIAKAYGLRANPKAAVTERVRKLADEIVKDNKTPREQARLLYEWVATKISYAGNCIGVGAVVPHDLSFVLDNKMGDCKDHATLLQALLAAKGIQSTQALVNARNVYRLPKIPVVSTVNHVINYIPSLDLYVDSTSQTTPFGMLPFAVEDKPVLLVDGTRSGAKTPALPVGTNQQHMKSVLEISPDGSITGDIEITLKGTYAANTRSSLRHLPKDQEADLVKNAFESSGYIGDGKIDKDDPTPLLDAYKYKINLRLEKFVSLPGAGAFAIYPLFYSEAPVHRYVAAATLPEEIVDVACANGLSAEEYTIRLPKDMKVLAIPTDTKLSNDFLSYSAAYRMDGNTLRVKRTFDDRTRGNICSPTMMTAYKKFAQEVLQNMKAQVVYQ